MHSRNNALFLLPGRDGVQIQPSAGQAELRRQHSDRRSATPEDTEVEDAERANVQRLQSELPDSLKRRQGAREWAKGMNKAQSKPQAKPLEVFLPSVVSRAAPVVVAAVRVLEDEEATNNKGSAKDKAPLSAYSSVSKQQQINKIYALTKTSAVAKGSTASFLRRRLPQRQAALPPSNDIALQLDPIPQLAKTESGLRQQEDMLARRLDAQIVQYGEDIPLSFLRSRHHGAFAQRMAVHHLVRLLERQHMRAVATAFLSWHKTTITRRILATHARQVFLARQTALAHACALVQRKIYVTMRQYVRHWYADMLHLRWIEHTRCATIIQAFWSKYRRVMLFRFLVQAYREQVRHRSAVRIQQVVRRFLARCFFQRLVLEHRQNLAAFTIQKSYHQYRVRHIARKRKQFLAACTVQRYARGYLGRQRCKKRRWACRTAVQNCYFDIWLLRAFEVYQWKASLVTKIQKCYRSYLFRCQLAVGMASAFCRRNCIRGSIIQRAWNSHRSYSLFSATNHIILTIEAKYDRAASLFQRAYRRHRKIRRQAAATKLSLLFRQFLARRQTIPLALTKLRVFSASFIAQTVPRLRPHFQWFDRLMQLTDDIDNFHADQDNKIRRFNSVKAARLLAYCTNTERLLIKHCAGCIQLKWRVHHMIKVFATFSHATRVLCRSVPLRYRQFRQRRRRRHVLGRWRRIRWLHLRDWFHLWRQNNRFRKEARLLKTSQEKLRKAHWFRHQKLRKQMFRGWMDYVAYQQYWAMRRRQALGLYHKHAKRRTIGHWKNEALPEVTARNRLNEFILTIEIYDKLLRNKVREKKKKFASAWHRERVMRRAWTDLLDLVNERREKSNIARKNFNTCLSTKALHAFHARVQFLVQVDAFSRKKRSEYAIRQWAFHMALHVQHVRSVHNAAELRLHMLVTRSWRQLKRYVAHQKKQREIMKNMERYHARSKQRRSVSKWRDRLPFMRDYNLIARMGRDCYAFKILKHIFRRGFAVFWAMTAGKKRIEMATRIQRSYRSRRARLGLFKMRMALLYQIEKRIEFGTDVCEYTTETLFQSFKTHVWTFALVTFPWQLVMRDQRLVYYRVATTWAYLRHYRMKFGTLNAVDNVTVPSSTGNESGGEETYSVLTWFNIPPTALPCIVAFWQGRGHHSVVSDGLAAIERCRRRRLRVVRGDDRMKTLVLPMVKPYPTLKGMMEWVEGLYLRGREATAIDMQAYARRFLGRMLGAKLRRQRNQRIMCSVITFLGKIRRKWRLKLENRLALKLRRWARRSLKRREFWRQLRALLDQFHQACTVVQRATRRYFARKHFRAATFVLLTFPARYPRAPLCEECSNCLDESFALRDAKLAHVKCRDCKQAFCPDCFLRQHRSGKRMLHLTDPIDVQALDDDNMWMCGDCEVQRVKIVCDTCDLTTTNSGLCANCFDSRHIDAHRFLKHNIPTNPAERLNWWWDSRAFKYHKWRYYRANTEKSDQPSKGIMRALQIRINYQWVNYSTLVKKHEHYQKIEHEKTTRRLKIELIRQQQSAIVREAFDRYDTDHSGSIDHDEFKRMYREELCVPLTDAQAELAIRAMDKSGNGMVEFDELLNWFAEDMLSRSGSGLSSLDLLRQALLAKRKMRRYREKLNEYLPHKKVETPKVPGFPKVELVDKSEFITKKRVFFRFLKEIYQLQWIFEDEPAISMAHAQELFEQIFVPKWNAGELTYDLYYDDESFKFKGESWKRRWNGTTEKFEYTTRRKRKRQRRNRKPKRSRSIRKLEPIAEGVEDEEADEEDMEEYEVVEMIDPRRKESLFEQAREAFIKGDRDASGYIDEKEFRQLMIHELCEPITKAKAKAVLGTLDRDGNGKIDIEEFSLWYATEKSQDYPTTVDLERMRLALRTKRRVIETTMVVVGSSIENGKRVKKAWDKKVKEQRLIQDSKGASPELIALLEEGHAKLLAMKALRLHQGNLEAARQYLINKQEEVINDKEKARIKREENRIRMKQKRAESAKRRRERMAAARKKLKEYILGPDKQEAHANKLQDAIKNLDREIFMVERDMEESAKRRRRAEPR